MMSHGIVLSIVLCITAEPGLQFEASVHRTNGLVAR